MLSVWTGLKIGKELTLYHRSQDPSASEKQTPNKTLFLHVCCAKHCRKRRNCLYRANEYHFFLHTFLNF